MFINNLSYKLTSGFNHLLIKRNITLLVFGCFFLCSVNLFSYENQNIKTDTTNYFVYNFNEYKKLYSANKLFSHIKNFDKQFHRWEDFWKYRVEPNGDFRSGIEIYKEFSEFNKYKNSKATIHSKDWVEIGPHAPSKSGHTYSIKYANGNGRLNCIAFHPTDSNIIYVGAASGGLWYSTNAGQNWQTVDLSQFLSIGISDIAISQSNPDIIYAATGDAVNPFFRGFSIGIIKSTDKGQTWFLASVQYESDAQYFISKLIVDTKNPDILIAATGRGIKRSTNGGNSWFYLYEGDLVREMIIHPIDSNIIYASTMVIEGTSKIIRSTDNGITWEIIKEFDDVMRIKLAVTPSRPDYLYALNVAKNSRTHSFIYSQNKGDVWIDLTTGYEIITYQGHYNLVLEIAQKNPNIIYAGGMLLYKTTDLGLTWEPYSSDVRSDEFEEVYFNNNIHVDFHDLKFNPHNNLLYVATDGGIFRKEKNNEWTNLSYGLGIRQLYRIGVNHWHPEMFIAGSQDNGTVLYDNGKWKYILVGDGMDGFFDYSIPQRVYASLARGMLFRMNVNIDDVDTYLEHFENFAPHDWTAWITPFFPNPHNTKSIYAGTTGAWKSEDEGFNWRSISNIPNQTSRLNAMAISAADTNYLAIANNENLFVTKNEGKDWDLVFTSEVLFTSITFHPTNKNIFVVTFGSFLKDQKVLIFDLSDLDNIINISSGLPNVSINDIIFDIYDSNIMYAATDLGVYKYDGMNWELLGNGLPYVIVNEIEINPASGYLYAGTFGRGVWKYPIYECNNQIIELDTKGTIKVCSNESIKVKVIDPLPEREYLWSNGVQGTEVELNKPGSYYVAAKRANGCVDYSENINIELIDFPEFYVNLLTQNEICYGDTAVYVARVVNQENFENLKLKWSTGATSDTIKIAETGKYSLQVEYLDCISSPTVFDVKVYPEPHKPIITKKENFLYADETFIHYTWFLNDTELETDNARSIRLSKLGTYRLLAMDSNYCEVYSEPFDVDIQNNNGQQINIQTNPLENELSFELYVEKEGSINIELYDLLGKLAFKHQENVDEGFYYKSIKFNNYSSNIMFLQIKMNAQIVVTKLVKI